jgi:hypothetical protein
MEKQRYKIRNWKEYNEALVNRGSLTFWFDEDVIAAWHDVENIHRGHPFVYSDVAILCGLSLKVIFQLPLRATEGLLCSLVELMDLPIQVPDYTTLCRRQSKLELEIPTFIPNESRHVVVDSFVLKIFGEGEWKVRQHGHDKRRTWRKLHLGIDEQTQEIVAAVLTTNDIKDNNVLEDLLEQVEEPINQVSADGAYDTFECYEQILEIEAEPVIPPRVDAALNSESNERPEIAARNQVVRKINEPVRKKWKQTSGYHRRSLTETAMFRIKTLFGNQLKARLFESQAVEAFVRCIVLNRMTFLGLPDSYPIA